MTGSGKTTQEAIRKAIEIFRTQVLNPRYLNPETGIYKYPYPISEKEVLILAGVKSRSTLKASYHDAVKAELKMFIAELKSKAGKRTFTETADLSALSKRSSASTVTRTRIDQLTQTIGALGYKIIALEKELDQYRRETSSQSKVVNLQGKRRRRPDGSS